MFYADGLVSPQQLPPKMTLASMGSCFVSGLLDLGGLASLGRLVSRLRSVMVALVSAHPASLSIPLKTIKLRLQQTAKQQLGVSPKLSGRGAPIIYTAACVRFQW